MSKNRGFIFYKLQDRSTDEIKESSINNISGNRLIFDTYQPINPGVNLECEIYQHANPQRNIIMPRSLLAKVVLVRKIGSHSEPGDNKYRVELRFILKKILSKSA